MPIYNRQDEMAATPPVIILGGGANAISVARSLGRRGIKVYALNHPDSYVRLSRYAVWIATASKNGIEQSWIRFLLSSESDYLKGAVLLTGSDFGIEAIALNRDELEKKYILDISRPKVQLCMLNKLCTYEKACEAKIPTPRFWTIDRPDQVLEHEKSYVYPLIVKPIYSHKFESVFKSKFFLVNSFAELLDAYARVNQFDIGVMLVEKIIGPDDKLCSYYTYIDEKGDALFDFTKRIIRRFPMNEGGACYHVTDWNPEVRDLALKFLNYVQHVGLANVEFKRDDKDGKLKLIECNARFTAADCLVSASGIDLAHFVYHRLTGGDKVSFKGIKYNKGLHFWLPRHDYYAFKELRERGELGFKKWLLGLMHFQVLPYFRWYDPLPTIVFESKYIYRSLKKRLTGLYRLLKTYVLSTKGQNDLDNS